MQLQIQEKTVEVLAPLEFFFKDKDSTHTFNNKGQNCKECKLSDLPRGHMRGYCLLEDIATSIA